ncbi:hypothetical protein [Desulfonatronum parangueonense]
MPDTKVLSGLVQHRTHSSRPLRQSILKDAFAGRLVPQDPNDEPVSELLARIRAERGAGPKKRNARRGRNSP